MADGHNHDHDHTGHDHEGHDHDGTSTGSTDSGDAASSDTASWLFSFGASNVQAKATRKGHMTFSFKADDCSEITAFTDRPDRLKRQIKMKHFAKDFEAMFGDDMPNSSLTHWNMNGDFKNHVYEIVGIKKSKGKYIVKTDLLNEDYIKKVSNANNSDDPSTIGMPNPFAVGQGNFFIDSYTCYSCCELC